MLKAPWLLEVSGLSIAFGGVRALSDVSLVAHAKEILGVIGPNGAGKTTLFSVISGFLRPDSGSLRFADRDIGGLSPHLRCRLGLIRTWQVPRPFRTMTVRENILVCAVSDGQSMKRASPVVDEILDELGLHDFAHEPAADLPPGLKKRLEVARALVHSPRLLLLDEVMAGQTASEADQLFEVLRARAQRDGLSIIMIEHVIRAVRNLCDRVVVLSSGRILAEGVPAEVMARPDVVQAYLGNLDVTHLGGSTQIA